MSSSDATLFAAALTAVISIIVAIINLRQNRKLDTIHVLVNDRLDNALAQIDQLKAQLDQLKATIKP